MSFRSLGLTGKVSSALLEIIMGGVGIICPEHSLFEIRCRCSAGFARICGKEVPGARYGARVYQNASFEKSLRDDLPM